jgi:hypothetical protein
VTYISTDEFEKLDIKHGTLTESPLRRTTARYICNPIVDDIEAPLDPDEQYAPPSCLVVGEPSINDLASWRWQGADGRCRDGTGANPPHSGRRSPVSGGFITRL